MTRSSASTATLTPVLSPAKIRSPRCTVGPRMPPTSGGSPGRAVSTVCTSRTLLSPATLAGIFAGKITKWDDAAIKADNAGVSLPSSGIQVVYRSDSSGTTQVFTDYMRATAADVWTYGTSSKDWDRVRACALTQRYGAMRNCWPAPTALPIC